MIINQSLSLVKRGQTGINLTHDLTFLDLRLVRKKYKKREEMHEFIFAYSLIPFK